MPPPWMLARSTPFGHRQRLRTTPGASRYCFSVSAACSRSSPDGSLCSPCSPHSRSASRSGLAFALLTNTPPSQHCCPVSGATMCGEVCACFGRFHFSQPYLTNSGTTAMAPCALLRMVAIPYKKTGARFARSWVCRRAGRLACAADAYKDRRVRTLRMRLYSVVRCRFLGTEKGTATNRTAVRVGTAGGSSMWFPGTAAGS